MLFKKKRKETRTSILTPQTYDAEAQKSAQPFVFEGVDVGWTTFDYPVPKFFVQFYCVDFEKQANTMLEAVDEGVPHYMDQSIHNMCEEALGALIHKRAARFESISEIISRKRVTLNCHKRELDDLTTEYQRISTLVNAIGGYDYE